MKTKYKPSGYFNLKTKSFALDGLNEHELDSVLRVLANDILTNKN